MNTTSNHRANRAKARPNERMDSYMRPDYCPVGNEPCQSLCDVPCGKTDYQSLLREVLVHFYHDGVPVDAKHPKRITVTRIEKALK